MGRLHYVLLVVLFAGTTGCSNKEQVYEGMYQGFSSVEDMRMTRDPSYDPVRSQERKVPSYQQYKREQALKD